MGWEDNNYDWTTPDISSDYFAPTSVDMNPVDLSGFYTPQDYMSLLSPSVGNSSLTGLDLSSLGISPSAVQQWKAAADYGLDLDQVTLSQLGLAGMQDMFSNGQVAALRPDQVMASQPIGQDLSPYDNTVNVGDSFTGPDGNTYYKNYDGSLVPKEVWETVNEGKEAGGQGLSRNLRNGLGVNFTQMMSQTNPTLAQEFKDASLPYDPRMVYDATGAKIGMRQAQSELGDTGLGVTMYTNKDGTLAERPQLTDLDLLAADPIGRRLLLNSGVLDKDSIDQYVAALSDEGMGLGVDGSNSKESWSDRLTGALSQMAQAGRAASGSAKQVAQQKSKLQTGLSTAMMLAQALAAYKKNNQSASPSAGQGANAMKWKRV